MTTPNPVTRLLQLANTSERAFRDRFGYSKQYMVDVTAGTYTQLSDTMHEALKTLMTEKGVPVRQVLTDEYRATTLDMAYELWQSGERVKNRDKFVSIPPQLGRNAYSPAALFVRSTSGNPTRFSKDLKVPPQQVRRWVNGELQTTPGSIQDALRQIAYPWLKELLALQEQWLEKR